MEVLSDAACMDAIASRRDREAFGLLYRRYAPRVRAFLRRRNADAATSTEVTQEVMLTIWRKAETFDPARATVASWVFTIARNRYIDRIRRERRPEPEPEDTAAPSDRAPDRRVDASRRHARLREAVAELPSDQRSLIEMAYLEGRTQRDMAAATGLALGTVKSRVRLAMRRLRRAMDAGEEGPPSSNRGVEPLP
ncbi:MAG: sigma-70 family RNA polymerase sigma factor [Myxococcota bacterium]